MARPRVDAILFVTVFIVNFLSLVFQVVWTRKLMVVFGSTALSISTVLTVFLAGIALGGYIGGTWIKRVGDKGRLLGVALLVLGAYCLASTYLLGSIRYPFQYLAVVVDDPLVVNLLKLLFSFVVLIVPTTIIGAVFPVTTYLYSTGSGTLGKDVALIYFLDTLGAALGAIVCGFVLVPMAGLRATTLASGLLYMLVGLAVLASGAGRGTLGLPTTIGAGSDILEDTVRARRRGLGTTELAMLTALFLGGFSALVLEVAWSRYFHLLFGTSIYAFSLVIAAFLLGMSAGSLVMKRLIKRIESPLLAFAFIEVLIAGAALLVMQTSPLVERFYFKSFFAADNFYLFHGTLFVLSFLLMLVPTMLMGANFPLAVSILARSADNRGRDVGLAFAVNTSGGIVGAFAAGFLVIPLLGLEKTGMLASAVYLGLGLAFVLVYMAGRVAKYALALGALAAFALLFVMLAREPVLNYSVYYHGIQYDTFDEFREYKARVQTLFSRLGLYGLVAVNFDPVRQNYSLMHNGKADASTTGDMATQLFLGHLPLFMHTYPEKVLNIGLGGGFTVGAIASHPNVREIDVVEIDPLVAEATAKYFKDFNNDALADPRVRLHIQDGRHFLYTTRKKYDVIISEPPNMWVSGVSQLFTDEFYATVDERLNDGGLLIQWVPGFEMEKSDFLVILNTIRKRFGYVTFWTFTGDPLILASRVPVPVNPAYVQALLDVPAVRKDIERVLPGADPRTMLGILVNPDVGPGYIDGILRDVKLVNTDNLPYLEFTTARNIFNLSRRKR